MSNLADEISFFFQRVTPLAILDLLLVSAVFFFVISLLRGTRAVVLLRGMILLILVMALLTGLLPLPGFQSLLSTTLPALLFVPEESSQRLSSRQWIRKASCLAAPRGAR